MKFAEIIAANRELAAVMSGNAMTVHVLSNVTVQPLKDVLEYSLRSTGIPADVSLGGYDQIVQESAASDARVVVVIWEAANITEELPYRLELMLEAEREELLQHAFTEISIVAKNLAHVPLLLWTTFSALPFTSEYVQPTAYDEFIQRCNAHLNDVLPANGRLVNVDKLYARTSLDAALDWRGWYTARALHTVSFFKEFAASVKPWFDSLTGRAAKLLLMDCDNTIWGGILGEDGSAGLQLDHHQYPGSVFTEIQQRALALRKRGVLLGLCSKNNAADVDTLLRNDSRMVLKNEDLAVKRITWDSKPESIQDIARELNLGMDSFVFLDDSDFEIGLVREQLPSVATYKVPDTLYRYPALFRELETRFTQLSKSDEDLERTRQYREESIRAEERDRHADLESYLKGLGIQLTVYLNDTKLIPRIAQMTQKTNQFNLTTRRYTDADIAAFVESGDADVLAFGVCDRYGDSGITAVGILRHDASVTIIDSLLMSCRIIGRTIEYAIMNHIIAHCVARGTKTITGLFQSTEKNAQVAEYYSRCGFAASQPKEHGSNEFTLYVSQYKPRVLSYIELINA